MDQGDIVSIGCSTFNKIISMSEKVGLVKVAIRLVKKNDELVEAIMRERDLPEADRELIVDMLRLNIWTVNQFSNLTGFKQGTIANKCRPIYRDGKLDTELDYCYPFEDIEGLGPKFIVRNEKSEAMLPQPVAQANDAV